MDLCQSFTGCKYLMLRNYSSLRSLKLYDCRLSAIPAVNPAREQPQSLGLEFNEPAWMLRGFYQKGYQEKNEETRTVEVLAAQEL